MASKRLYVGNIPFSATEDDLRRFFDGYTLVDVKVITDRESGRPRGFAFVEVADVADVERAVSELNGMDFGGRSVVINEAKDRDSKSSGSRRDGGGYRRH